MKSSKKTHKIKKEDWELLRNLDGNLKVSQLKEIHANIQSRLFYIITHFQELFKITLEWADASRGDSWKNQYHPLFNDEDDLIYIGEDSRCIIGYPFGNRSYQGIMVPVRWLWEDFEKGLKKESESFRKTVLKHEKDIEKIKKKLTKKELELITFKKSYIN